MKRNLLIFLWVIGSFSAAKATHLLGGDISWDCLGNDSFKITFTAYRDCNELSFSSVNTKISSSCNDIVLTNTMSGGRDVTPVCGNSVSRCKDTASTFPYGLEEYTYTSIVDLSTLRKNGCCSIVISASICCRSKAITTGSANQNFYIESTMDLCRASCISAPKWKLPPVVYNCFGSDFVVDHGIAFDANSGIDSTIFELTEPMVNDQRSVTWGSWFSYDKPLPFLGYPKKDLPLPRGFHLDRTTGNIRFRPLGERVGMMAVKATIWSDGKIAGTITRDFQVVIIRCSGNNGPYLSGIDCGNPSINSIDIETCPGKEICFKVCSSDWDTLDSTNLVYNGGIPGASFKTLNPGAQYAQGQFCWTPTQDDISDVPHTFVITAKDNHCPIPRSTPLLFEITVRNPKPPLLYQDIKPIDSCGKYQMVMRDSAKNNLKEVYWLMNDSVPIGTGDTIEYTFADQGIRKITGVYNECPVVKIDDTIKVRHSSNIKYEFKNRSICANEPLRISSDLTGLQGTPSFVWSADSGVFIDSPNAKSVNLKFPNTSATYIVKLEVKDASACGTSRQFRVTTKKAKTVEIARGKSICEDDATVVPLDVYQNQGVWIGKGVLNNVFDPSSAGLGLHELFFKVEDNVSCVTDTAVFEITPLPQIAISDDISWCTDNTPIPLKSLPAGGQWTGRGITSSNQFDGQSLSKGTYKLLYSYSDSKGCTNKDSLLASVFDYAVGSVSAPDTASSCAYGSSFILLGSPKGGNWLGGGFASSGEELRIDPTLLSSGTYEIVYTYRDANQCGDSDTSKMLIYETPTAAFKVLDTVINQNDTLPVQNNSYEINGSKYLWQVGAPTSKNALGYEPRIIMDQLGMHEVTLITLDTLTGCGDTLTQTDAVNVIKFVGTTVGLLENIDIFPNPASNTLVIKNDSKNNIRISLFSISGRALISQDIRPGTDHLDVSDVAAGSYQLRLSNGSTTRTILIIKQ